MAWTMAQLIADLNSFYIAVGTPSNPTVGDPAVPEGTINGVTRYIVSVVEVGLSQINKKPTAHRKDVVFYVANQGLSNESAYYDINEPINYVNTDVTVTNSSYASIAALYYSTALQARVWVAMLYAASTVFQEATTTPNHAQRLTLVNLATTNPQMVIMQFMSAIALNATVQAQGNAVTDATLQSIITGSWNSYASLVSTTVLV